MGQHGDCVIFDGAKARCPKPDGLRLGFVKPFNKYWYHMPSAANIVVKDGAGVDKTFSLLTPAPGYGAPADWALKEGATSVVFPAFTLSANRTQNRSRKVVMKVRVPAVYTSVETGLPVVASNFEANVEVTVPDSFPETQKDDATAFVANLVGSALAKACYRDGLPAT